MARTRRLNFKAVSPQFFDNVPVIKVTQKRKTINLPDNVRATIDDADTSLMIENDELNLTLKKVSVDTETTGLNTWFGDQPWMVSMSDQENNSWCCMWPVDPYTRKVHYKKDEYWHYLKRVVEDETITKVYYNAKFDMRMLRNIGIVHKGQYEEVVLKARIFNSDEILYKLKYLSKKYCGLGNDEEISLKKAIKRLQRLARASGWKVFGDVETTNSSAKKDKAAPDYWLSMYAHLFLLEAEATDVKTWAEEYCRKDTLRTIILDSYYGKKFLETPSMVKTYDFELGLMDLVMEMEETGIRTFKNVAISERLQCLSDAEILLKELREECKDPKFLPGSPSAVAKYMFSPKPYGLGLPPTEKTPTGQYKTGHKEIGHFAYVDWVQKLFNYKAKTKAVSLFFDKYIDNLQDTGEGYHIIHAEINQSNTKTFRFSMSNPNLQQAANPDSSSKGSDVVQVRNAFGPRPGYVWWLFDYSAQEFRILGGLMQVQGIIDAVRSGQDIPTVLGNQTWGGRNNPVAVLQALESLELHHDTPSNNVVKQFWKDNGYIPGENKTRQSKLIFAEQILADFDYQIVGLEEFLGKKTVRTRTKMCLYGKAYGAGVNGVMSLLRCNETDAKSWLSDLDKRFPEMRREAARWCKHAEEVGYIENAYGRRLTVPSDRPYVATNYRIQGTAADMMKISMLNVNKFIKDSGIDARIVLTVHDELVVEIAEKYCKKWVIGKIKSIMEDHERYINLPLSVGIAKCIESWDKEEKMDHLFYAKN